MRKEWCHYNVKLVTENDGACRLFFWLPFDTPTYVVRCDKYLKVDLENGLEFRIYNPHKGYYEFSYMLERLTKILWRVHRSKVKGYNIIDNADWNGTKAVR